MRVSLSQLHNYRISIKPGKGAFSVYSLRDSIKHLLCAEACRIVWTVLVMIYSVTKQSVLREEPKSVLGMAGFVYGGDLERIAATYRSDRREPRGKFEDFVKDGGYEGCVFRVRRDEIGRPQVLES